jgi:hypothetical protein
MSELPPTGLMADRWRHSMAKSYQSSRGSLDPRRRLPVELYEQLNIQVRELLACP